VQRFGSKRGLLLTLSSGAAEFVDQCFATVRAEHTSPLDALVAAATVMTQITTTPRRWQTISRTCRPTSPIRTSTAISSITLSAP